MVQGDSFFLSAESPEVIDQFKFISHSGYFRPFWVCRAKSNVKKNGRNHPNKKKESNT